MNFGRVWKNRHIPFHVPSQVGRVIRSSANFGGGGSILKPLPCFQL